MAPAKHADTDELLRRAGGGDRSARDELFKRHRKRLRQMVAVRFDPRLRVRLDPSDVVQDVLMEASQRLSNYLRHRPLPFYPWLRQIAWEQLVHLRDRHIGAQKRSVSRERAWGLELSDESVAQLANCLVAPDTSPSEKVVRKEIRERVHTALDGMAPQDREVLVMWYLEQLNSGEIAAILDMTESGVKSRHRRALLRLTRTLSGETEEN